MLFKLRKRKINLSYDNSKKHLNSLLKILLYIVCVHSAVFWAFEPTNLFDSIWVTIISISTIGYGDISATTYIGKLTTMFLGLGGIFVLAASAEAFVSLRLDSKVAKREGKWGWKLEDHIVIANIPNNYSTDDVIRLIESIRKIPEFTAKRIQILTNKYSGTSMPDDIFGLGDVVFYDGLPSRASSLEAINVDKASHVVILSLYDDNDPDGYTFDVIRRIRDINKDVNILVQCQKDSERSRLKKAGANSCIRPIRAYPEIIAHVMSHNSIMVSFIEDLMSKEGDELNLIKLNEQYQMINVQWKDVIEKLSSNNRGLALGYVSQLGEVVFRPPLNGYINIHSLILLEYSDSTHDVSIESILFPEIK